ncbi:unnamed protein product [Urochloa decumbens]|uniref:DUF4220 domain-containing protein n=1 Tax=Urochloa decumbens TaxID=240449 RepID=A0ABC8VYR9_9POAL
MVRQHAGGNTTSDQVHHLIDLWATARAMVFRIEGFALAAILLSFFVVIFGSCRRWSNRWIIQKGFLAASALSVSLGTYSIGLMQSSSVKSRMYPVWSVSLFVLFVSVDSINAYSVDYSGQLLKMMYQLCLYFGYVLLITISSAASSDAAVNAAIGVLCAITLCKGIHRLMAYVFPSRLRNMSQHVAYHMGKEKWGSGEGTMVGCPYMVFLADGNRDKDMAEVISMEVPSWFACLCCVDTNEPTIPIDKVWQSKMGKLDDVHAYKDICLSFSLCHLLQRRFFGFHCAESGLLETRYFFEKVLLRHRLSSPAGPSRQQTKTEEEEEEYDHEGVFKVIEAELAFLYDYMYSSDAFLYYYEAGVSTAWTLASIIMICFLSLLVAAKAQSLAPEAAQLGESGAVDTTTADVVITIVPLASLAYLQVLQLLRCWSSNWSKLSLACRLAKKETMGRRMRLKATFLGKMKWLDQYQWQNKLGQLSLVDDSSSICKKISLSFAAPLRDCGCLCLCLCYKCPNNMLVGPLVWAYYYLLKMFGLRYIRQALRDTLGYGPGGSIDLTPDVKKAIVDTLRRTDGALTNGSSSLATNGVLKDFEWACTGPKESWERNFSFPECCLPRSSASQYHSQDVEGNQAFVILTWHIATCHCDRAYRSTNLQRGGHKEEETSTRARIKRYHGVATSLSKYCAYLVAYVPELLPGNQSYTRAIYDDTVRRRARDDLFKRGEELGEQLLNRYELRRWKVLSDFWAEMLLYLAPSDNGGKFITHLWALLFHGGIVSSSPAAPAPADDQYMEVPII